MTVLLVLALPLGLAVGGNEVLLSARTNLCSIEAWDALFHRNTNSLSAMCDNYAKSGLIRSQAVGKYYVATRAKAAMPYLNLLAETNESVLPHLWIGQLLWSNDRITEAMAKWKQVPASDVYFARLAAHSASSGDLNEALELATISQELTPAVDGNRRLMYAELCRNLHLAGKQMEALSWCETWTQVQGGWSYIYLSQTQYALKDGEGALVSIWKAMDLNYEGTRSVALDMFEKVYRIMKPGRAAILLRGYLRWADADPWLHLLLALALHNDGSVEEACAYYDMALERGYEEVPPSGLSGVCHN